MSRKGPPITQAQPLAARHKYKVDVATAMEMRRLRAEEHQSFSQIARRFAVQRGTVMHWVKATNYLPLAWVKPEADHA